MKSPVLLILHKRSVSFSVSDFSNLTYCLSTSVNCAVSNVLVLFCVFLTILILLKCMVNLLSVSVLPFRFVFVFWRGGRVGCGGRGGGVGWRF